MVRYKYKSIPFTELRCGTLRRSFGLFMSTIYSCVIGLLFFYFACYFFLACLASFFVPNELALLLLYQVLRGA